MVETQKVEGLTQRGGTDPVGLTLVIFSGVVVAGGLFGISTIVSADNTTLAGVIEKSEVVRNVGLFLLGVIGLPLAIWRSWIAKQQVDEAIAQGRRTERQLQHAEKQLLLTQTTGNLGFIEKGGAMLEDEKSAARTTGVQILDAVLRQEQDAVAEMAAANVLFQFVKYHEKKSAVDYYMAAVALLKWQGNNAISGATNANELISGGESNIELCNADIRGITFTQNVYFDDCRINLSTIAFSGVKITDSILHECLITSISDESENIIFKECDFSGADITGSCENFTFTDCYYHIENAPTDATLEKIGERLEARDGISAKFNLS